MNTAVTMAKPHPGVLAPAPAWPKAWLNLQARAALAGFVAELGATDSGRISLTVSRLAMTRSFTDLAAAEAWLTLVGAPGAAEIS